MSSPNNKKIKKTTLTRVFNSGEVGESPKNQGRSNKTLPGFAKTCATHAIMIQLSGDAEASISQMNATIQALARKCASEGVHIILSLINGMDTNTGNLKLGKEASVATVKVLLPGIDPGGKVKDYKTMLACEKRLLD